MKRALSFLIGALVLAIPIVIAHWLDSGDLSLDERLAQKPVVHATEIAADWDQVCVATPYCQAEGGDPDGMADVCKEMPDDSDYGLGFFRDGKVTHTELYTKNPRKLTSKRRCFSRDEDPVIVVHDGNLLLRPAGEAP